MRQRSVGAVAATVVQSGSAHGQHDAENQHAAEQEHDREDAATDAATVPREDAVVLDVPHVLSPFELWGP